MVFQKVSIITCCGHNHKKTLRSEIEFRRTRST